MFFPASVFEFGMFRWARYRSSSLTTAMGITFTVQSMLIFGLLGYFSGSVGQWLNHHARTGLWLDRLAGIIFVGLGLRLMAGQ